MTQKVIMVRPVKKWVGPFKFVTGPDEILELSQLQKMLILHTEYNKLQLQDKNLSERRYRKPETDECKTTRERVFG